MAGKIPYIKKRDGKQVSFDPLKIQTAVKKAFLSQNISDETVCSNLTNEVVKIIEAKYGSENIPTVEKIQDIVEFELIRSGYTSIAKSYILYRQEHTKIRQEKTLKDIKAAKLHIQKKDGSLEIFNPEIIHTKLDLLARGLDKASTQLITDEVCKTVYNEIPSSELHDLLVNSAKSQIEKHYDYSYLSARIVLNQLYEDVLSVSLTSDKLSEAYKYRFADYIYQGIDLELLDPELAEFDLAKIEKALDAKRDLKFFYLGMQTIYDRYLLRNRKATRDIIELPQWLWMRVAMGLALKEEDRETHAIEFYNVLSDMNLVSSTPTLFNSGTRHPQMSSCYLNTVEDSMTGIFKNYADNAQLSKWAGGIGTDWTQIRGKGAGIKGTNGSSQGIIPFIKIFNDVALAVNQGGKRKGAMAAYLEIWHADIEEFLELKKNTGDERRRAHDIHTACFIPDLFMQRVAEKGTWTLFSPDSVKGLHDNYGRRFKQLYEYFEKQDIPGKKTVDAVDLWRKLLTMLYETGHPWVTFKDPMNIRNPQDHTGRIHNSNLCTEITLNTSKDETAVCNLASVNLANMVNDKKLDEKLLEETVTIGMRMLDNVIDNNFYPTVEAKNSNMRHRPVGLGVMGYQDALYKLEIDFDSDENLEFADTSMEMISYYAILASSRLAKERGVYETFAGSKWDRGIFPFDTMALLEEERGEELTVDRSIRMTWDKVKAHVKEHGMRNSNCMAIAPTATISNIAGTTPCVEPTYKNIYMKENLSGNFMVLNRYLIDALDNIGLWNERTVAKLKINNGSVLGVDEIPVEIRRRFKETFEIDPKWVIMAAARRAKWIDQSASTNVFMKTTSGKAISDVYTLAWKQGLKTTYYLRSLAASQVTKTVSLDHIQNQDPEVVAKEVKACSLIDPDCEVCQ